MKRLFGIATVLTIISSAFFTSCGPSADELEAQRIADSTRVADSLATIALADSLRADSILQAEAAAAAAAAAAANQGGGDDGGDDGGSDDPKDSKFGEGGSGTGDDTKESKENKFGGGEGEKTGTGTDTEEKKKSKFGKK